MQMLNMMAYAALHMKVGSGGTHERFGIACLWGFDLGTKRVWQRIPERGKKY
jgi:hypothetical protein